MYVAVYGTLKAGFGNHPIISNYIASDSGDFKERMPCGLPQGSTFTIQDYQLYLSPTAGFPACVQKPSSSVDCELYWLPDEAFRRLDALEGVPHLYNRISVVATHDTNLSLWAELYVLPKELAESMGFTYPSNSFTYNSVFEVRKWFASQHELPPKLPNIPF